MKNKLIGITSLLLIVVLSGCQTDEPIVDESLKGMKTEKVATSEESVINGVIRVKLASEIGDKISISSQGAELKSNVPGINSYLKKLHAKDMKRVFPYAGKFEERTRKEGLHLWYEIKFSEDIPVTRAVSEAAGVPGVVVVEKVIKISIPQTKKYPTSIASTRTETGPFDDPGLRYQWHYNNVAEHSSFIAQADINLFPAWEIETGKPEVIVAVVDQGVDYNHVDLIENMWINLAELNGEDGVDSDGNGFIDDIYGYNFALDNGEITPGNHGTHVAGIIGARNNNSIGVCGIAGGDGTVGSGVRLMSCQLFDGDNSSNSAAAIKYGADNGAIISQNSWGYVLPVEISETDKAAIDYFIKYAGCDNDGKQLPNSPMKGGVVIFAAGNESWDVPAYPAAYSPVISVSAMAPDFKKAWYTNRGEWISIMAPGGDEYYDLPYGMVCSTVIDNEYAFMEGTSMACPHVSGIAALAVSRYGGQGFTNEDLKTRILGALKSENIDEHNPEFVSRLGNGYIDAFRVFETNENKPPASIDKVEVNADYQMLELSWKAVSDEDDGTAIFYNLYCSDQEKLNDSNYESYSIGKIKRLTDQPGETILHTIENLSTGHDYHFCIVAEDRWGLKSSPFFFSTKTKVNLPPAYTITGAENIRVNDAESAEVVLSVSDPEGQEWKYKLTGERYGVDHKRVGDDILISFRNDPPIGHYVVTVTISDILNFSTTIDIPFEVYKNKSPVQVNEFKKQYIPITKQDYSIKLSDYFTDPDGHEITYSVSPFNSSIADAQLNGDMLTIKPVSIGNTVFTITASDKQEAKTISILKAQVVQNELVYIVYPIPVTSELNIHLNDEVEKVEITIRNTTGALVLKRSVTLLDNDSSILQLDLSNISAGTYMLYVKSEDKKYTKSFIKY